ncbi:MAG: response regulator [Candidatus Kapabacteria bacterium]|nr:response regulator [Candidatus Kapabacteria bacterium]
MEKLILIIEDEFQIREDISQVLKLNDYNTIESGNGLDGVAMAKKHLPDLIICDVMMPIMDGYQALEELQKNPQTSVIPFLFLTAKSTKDDIRSGMNIGADDYLTKPFDFKDLISAVKTRLNKTNVTNEIIEKKYDNLKSTISSSFPHELRTPLISILGFSDLLRKNLDKMNINDAKEMAGDIYSEGTRLYSLFEHFITYSELELILLKQNELEKLRSKTSEMIENTIKSIGNNIAESYDRQFDIRFYLQDYCIKIYDKHFIKLLECIIDNAFKFSDKNTLVEIRTNKENENMLLSIKDNGIGMSNEQIAQIGAYVQFDRKENEQKGTGLGLAIAQKITEVYKGDFSIRSNGKSNTTIEIMLPIK